MKKNVRFLTAGLLVVTMVLAPAVGMAQDKPKTPPAGSAPEKPAAPAAPVARALPFRGTVAAVDKAAKTVTVGERVFHIASDTKLMKGSQAAMLADINVGDAISGNYTKADDGKLTAKSPAGEQTDKKPVEKKKKDDAQ